MKNLIEEYLANLEKAAQNSIQVTLNEYPNLLSMPLSNISFYYSGPRMSYASSYSPYMFINKVGDLCVQIDETVHIIGKLCEYEKFD